jgi:lipid II:glycine glycyltransferase (peptidoglycan interpeptide bridge formation enzyme)
MEDMPLSDICRYLERNYNVSIFLQPGLEKKRYNGVIGEDNITDVMKALSRLSDIGYTVNGRKISITTKNKSAYEIDHK